MLKIEKSKETMSARERVKRTFDFEKTDRVTIGYEANPTIHNKLCKLMGINPKNEFEMYRALGVDYCEIMPNYTGKWLFEQVENRLVNGLEGFLCRWVENDFGGYWDFCDFPLKDAAEEAFYNYPVPNPDDYDYDSALEKILSLNGEFATYIGSPGMPDIINGCGRIMGMEDILCALITEDDATLDLINRRTKWQIGLLERLLNKCKGYIDFIWIGEDLGTQHTPLISHDLYVKTLKPVHKQFVDLSNSYNVPLIVHSCGSASWVYNDFIEMGVKGVDTLQPEATNMSPKYLAENFGGKLNFRGCISTAGPLAYGTEDDVTNICRETLEIMKNVRGYHFAPTHQIQDNTPPENIIAMYNAVHKYGKY